MASFENYYRILPLPLCRKTSCFSIRYQEKLIDPVSVCWYVTKENWNCVVTFENSFLKFLAAFLHFPKLLPISWRGTQKHWCISSWQLKFQEFFFCKKRLAQNVPLPFRLVVDWWTKWREGPLARISPGVWCSDCQYRWWRYDFVRSHRLSWNFHGEFFPCFVITAKMCTIDLMG